jgi:hypothetical protein
LAERKIDPKKVERAVDRIGGERLAQRDTLVASWEKLTLKQRDGAPCGDVPEVAAIMTDGGRMQIRPHEGGERARAGGDAQTGPPPAGPAPGPPAGGDGAAAVGPADEQGQRRQRFWREDKVAALLHMSSESHASDPCPELPEVFRDPLVVVKLAREVGHTKAVPQAEQFQSQGSEHKQKEAQEQEQAEQEHQQRQHRPGRPEVERRRVVATRQDNDAFGPMVAAAAWSLGLMAAPRRAFVADGSEANWSIHKKYFPRFTPVADFIHVLSYVFAAAMAGRPFAEGWPVYQEWLEWVWQGKVKGVLEALRQRLEALPEGSADWECVQKSLGYLEGQKGRLDYARYRKEGLPIMSSIVESTVKQIGRRVKGSEKFWSEEGAEAVLQLRADYLSDDEPMEHFWEERGRRMTGQRSYRPRAG